MMTCSKCGVSREQKEFYLQKDRPNRSCVCRLCRNADRTALRRKAGVRTRQENAHYMRQYRNENKVKILATRRQSRIANPMASLWRQIIRRKDRLAMTKQEFMGNFTVPETCPILGIPISRTMTRDHFPSVDRIDPNKPYSIGNIAIVSYRANMIKSVGSSEEHLKIAKWMQLIGCTTGKSLDWTRAVRT